MAEIILFGTGHEASVAHYYFERDTEHQVAGFTVDRDHVEASTFRGLPVVPFEDVTDAFAPSRYKMHVPIAYTRINKLRAEKYFAAKEKGYDLVSYVSSKATVWQDLEMGDNCFVAEHAVIQPFARIGNNVVIKGSTELKDVETETYCVVDGIVVLKKSVNILPGTKIGAVE